MLHSLPRCSLIQCSRTMHCVIPAIVLSSALSECCMSVTRVTVTLDRSIDPPLFFGLIVHPRLTVRNRHQFTQVHMHAERSTTTNDASAPQHHPLIARSTVHMLGAELVHAVMQKSSAEHCSIQRAATSTTSNSRPNALDQRVHAGWSMHRRRSWTGERVYCGCV